LLCPVYEALILTIKKLGESLWMLNKCSRAIGPRNKEKEKGKSLAKWSL